MQDGPLTLHLKILQQFINLIVQIQASSEHLHKFMEEKSSNCSFLLVVLNYLYLRITTYYVSPNLDVHVDYVHQLVLLAAPLLKVLQNLVINPFLCSHDHIKLLL